jgi:hypothetical protein
MSNMRALVINDEVRANINRCVARAAKPEHYLFCPESILANGDDPAFVIEIPDGYRCAHRYMLHSNFLYRHLSVSVAHSTLYPAPQAVAIIACLFGFTGGTESDLDIENRMEHDGWIVRTNKQERHVILMQPARIGAA